MSTTQVESRGTVLGRPLKGLVFVVLWILAIAAWVVAPFMVDPAAGAFFIDTGVILASVGFAALFLEWSRSLVVALIWAAIAVALAAVGDFVGLVWLSATLRLIAPILAINTMVGYLVGRIRVFA